MGASYTRALFRTLTCFLNSSPVDISQVFWQNSALWDGEHKSLLFHLPMATSRTTPSRILLSLMVLWAGRPQHGSSSSDPTSSLSCRCQTVAGLVSSVGSTGPRARLGFSLLHVVPESRLSMLSSWKGPGLLGGGPEHPNVQDPRGRKLKLAGQTWNWHTSAGLA